MGLYDDFPLFSEMPTRCAIHYKTCLSFFDPFIKGKGKKKEYLLVYETIKHGKTGASEPHRWST